MNPAPPKPATFQWQNYAVLSVVAAILLAVLGGWGYVAHGTSGLAFAVAAVFVCYLAAVLAMVLLILPIHPFARSVLSIAARTALPLGIGAWVIQNFAISKELGLLGVFAYLAMLTVETLLVARGDRNVPAAFRAMLSKKEVV